MALFNNDFLVCCRWRYSTSDWRLISGMAVMIHNVTWNAKYGYFVLQNEYDNKIMGFQRSLCIQWFFKNTFIIKCYVSGLLIFISDNETHVNVRIDSYIILMLCNQKKKKKKKTRGNEKTRGCSAINFSKLKNTFSYNF